MSSEDDMALVAKIRDEVDAWRQKGYAGGSATSVSLLRGNDTMTLVPVTVG